MKALRTEAGGTLTLLAQEERAEPEDEALCRAFLAGEGRAFGVLVERHRGLVFRVLRRYVARPEDVADLAQQAFLRAFEASRRAFSRWGAGPAPFRAWVVRIALNLARNHARHRSRWRSVALVDVQQGLSSHGESAQDALERAERQRRVQGAVLELPRRQREVLTLRVDGGLAFKDIAQVLGTTENNAKVLFHHAVKRLRTTVGEAREEEG